jgi:hypothetical protein
MKKKILPFSKRSIDYPEISELNLRPNTLPCTFLGELCQQSFNAFFVWEKVLSEGFTRFIELGTGRGNTSTYFKLFCINVGAKFYTYEKRIFGFNKIQEFIGLKRDIIRGNLFERTDEILKLISSSGKSVVFCDAFDKPHEFKTFAPALKKGDIISAHDWGRAIKGEWVKTIIEENNLKELFREERLSLNTATGIFEKI